MSFHSHFRFFFRLSIDQGIFPDTWKISSLTSIQKSNNSSEIKNYRPITILSHISKIFEALVLNYILSSLMNNMAFARDGLLSHVSSHCVIIYIFSSFDNGAQVDVIYTDSSKAFDSVNHKVLHILQFSGFDDPHLSWFESFLRHRPQWVKLFNIRSAPFIWVYPKKVISHLYYTPFSSIMLNLCYTIAACYILQTS